MKRCDRSPCVRPIIFAVYAEERAMKRILAFLLMVPAVMLLMAAVSESTANFREGERHRGTDAEENAERLIDEGRHIFRFDTFGDEAFWTDALQMQKPVSM